MQKILSMLLAIIMIISVIPLTVVTAESGDTTTTVSTAPSTFPDGTAIMLTKQITDGYYDSGDNTTNISARVTDTTTADGRPVIFQNITSTIFDNGTVDASKYDGIMFKIDGTGNSSVKPYFRLLIDVKDGESTKTFEFGSNVSSSAGRKSTSYQWITNNEEWSQQDGGSSGNCIFTANRVGYVYFPFEADILPTDWNRNCKIVSVGIYNATRANIVYSDFCFVYSQDKVITGASVTLTDDLAWNVYANVPDNCTDSKVTFTYDGITKQATLADGKYSLKDILPQQISSEITATWTGTVNGQTVTDTATSSIETYCRKLLTDTDWSELVKALLHYGAAAQKVAGYTGTLCNDGVESIQNPVDLTAISAVKTNNDADVWKSATLRLDGSLAMKIKVSAPEGITKVTATVADRSAPVELDITDGYVILPLNAHELGKTVTFSYGEDDKTLEIDANFILKNTTSETYKELAQAIANYGNEAAGKKQ